MNLGVETAEMGWDLSIRAQSRRSLAINSIWLQEEGDRDNRGIDAEFRNFRKEQKTPGWKIRYGENVDPVLGFTLAGGSLHVERGKENLTPNAMDQDPEEVAMVSDLIDNINKKWKTELIVNTFQKEIAQKILQIPLARTDCEDMKVWKGELSGDFTVRSAYKLLQDASLDPSNYLLQADTKDFYRKLWNLQLPTKILIFIWRISWNYIPSLANLRYKRVTTIVRCLQGCSAEEDSFHVFRQCPVSMDAWISLNMAWVTEHTDQSTWPWLTWVFSRGTKK
ncbi:hypothetical protein Gotur_032280 [Gossypium turneri]